MVIERRILRRFKRLGGGWRQTFAMASTGVNAWATSRRRDVAWGGALDRFGHGPKHNVASIWSSINVVGEVRRRWSNLDSRARNDFDLRWSGAADRSMMHALCVRKRRESSGRSVRGRLPAFRPPRITSKLVQRRPSFARGWRSVSRSCSKCSRRSSKPRGGVYFHSRFEPK